jgi:hypothetical protein
MATTNNAQEIAAIFNSKLLRTALELLSLSIKIPAVYIIILQKKVYCQVVFQKMVVFCVSSAFFRVGAPEPKSAMMSEVKTGWQKARKTAG